MAHAGAAAGGQLEEKVDLSAQVEEKMKQAQSLVDGGSIPEALALLAALEKKCRVGNDNTSLTKVCVASIEHSRASKDVALIVSTLTTLCTRRSQKSAAIKAMVQLIMPWVTDGNAPIDTEYQGEDRLTLVVALRDMTDGKIYLEAERARLTRALATMKVCVCLREE